MSDQQGELWPLRGPLQSLIVVGGQRRGAPLLRVSVRHEIAEPLRDTETASVFSISRSIKMLMLKPAPVARVTEGIRMSGTGIVETSRGFTLNDHHST